MKNKEEEKKLSLDEKRKFLFFLELNKRMLKNFSLIKKVKKEIAREISLKKVSVE